MTTLESGASSAPAGREAGVLFGLGRGKPIGTEFAKGWRYQAPSRPPELSSPRPPKTPSALLPFWQILGSDALPWETEQAANQSLTKTDRNLDQFLHVPEEPVADAKANLDILLTSLSRKKEEVTHEDLDTVFAILSSPFHERDGPDLIRVIQVLTSRSSVGVPWECLAGMLRSSVEQGMTSTAEVVSVFRLIFEHAKDWEYVSRIFVMQLATTDKGALIDVTELIVSAEDHRAKSKSWLGMLRRFHPAVRDARVTSPSWKGLYALLAKHFQPSDQHVVDHFGWLRRSELAQVLFEFYLPTWLAEAERGTQDGHRPPDVAISAARDLLRQSLDPTKEIDAIYEEVTPIDYAGSRGISLPSRAPLNGLTSSSSDSRISPLQVLTRSGKLEIPKARFLLSPEGHYVTDTGAYVDNYAILDLVVLLVRHKIPYARLLDEAFEVYMQTQPNNMTKNLFLKLRNQKNCGIPTTLAEKLMQHFLASGEHAFAFYVFRHTPTLPLLPYADLVIKLIEKGETHGEKIFQMLLRYHPEERIPVGQRAHRRLNITQEHINLIHKVAYAFASSEHLRPRTALRRVWECYRFLRDRRAPLQPLISRALVRAGLSRPLIEYERLSEAQVRYIISIVEKVESPAIAKEVDRIVWDAWELTLRRQWAGPVPPPAKGPEGQGQWYENKRRLWQKSGGRVYMPFETSEPHDDGKSVESNHRNQNNEFVVDSGTAESNMTTDEAPNVTTRTDDFQSSLTEMDEVAEDLPLTWSPAKTQRTTQFTAPMIESTHDTTLSDPSEPSLLGQLEADTIRATTSKQGLMEGNQAPITVFLIPRSASRQETAEVADDYLSFKSLNLERPSTEPTKPEMDEMPDDHLACETVTFNPPSIVPIMSETNDRADDTPIFKTLHLERPSTALSVLETNDVAGGQLSFRTLSFRPPSTDSTKTEMNDGAENKPVYMNLRLARPSALPKMKEVANDQLAVRTLSIGQPSAEYQPSAESTASSRFFDNRPGAFASNGVVRK